MVLDLGVVERQHWFHIGFRGVIGVRLNAFVGTGLYNGHKRHKWSMNG